MKLMGPGRQWDLQDSVGRGGLDFGESRAFLWILRHEPYPIGQVRIIMKPKLFSLPVSLCIDIQVSYLHPDT